MFDESIVYTNRVGVRGFVSNMGQCPLHSHEGTLEIICLLSGSISISDSCLSHRLSPGDVYLFNSGDSHRIHPDGKPNAVLTIQIDLAYYSQYVKKLSTIYFFCDAFINREHLTIELSYIRSLLASIQQEYDRILPGEILLEELTRKLLSYFVKKFEYAVFRKDRLNKDDFNGKDGACNQDFVSSSSKKVIDQNVARFFRIVEHISDHFREKLKLQDIANREHMSIFHLSRIIKEGSGLNFTELLSLFRCEEAERLLLTTKMTIDRIALECGFANRKHLSLQFVKWYGKSPSAFRSDGKSEQGQTEARDLSQDYDQLEVGLILASYIEANANKVESGTTSDQLLSYLVLLHISHNAFSVLQSHLQRQPKKPGKATTQADLLTMFEFNQDFPDFKKFAENIDAYLIK